MRFTVDNYIIHLALLRKQRYFLKILLKFRKKPQKQEIGNCWHCSDRVISLPIIVYSIIIEKCLQLNRLTISAGNLHFRKSDPLLTTERLKMR